MPSSNCIILPSLVNSQALISSIYIKEAAAVKVDQFLLYIHLLDSVKDAEAGKISDQHLYSELKQWQFSGRLFGQQSCIDNLY